MVTLTTSSLVNDDGDVPTCAPHLSNSSILGDLGSYLMHLSEKQFEDVCNLIQSFPLCFLMYLVERLYYIMILRWKVYPCEAASL